MTVRGALGELRWSYHLAGTIREWTVTQDAGARVLTGTMVVTDAFRLSQQPLVFVAQHATGAWLWPIDSLQIADGALTARLGPRGT